MAFEQLQARWEQTTPRERVLVLGLGALLLLAILFFVTKRIGDGLTQLEEKNENTRLALKALERHRQNSSSRTSNDPVDLIKETAPELDSYLDGIIGELKLDAPAYPSRKSKDVNDFVEVTMAVRMPNPITVYELKDLLQKIETKDRRVVVRELNVKRNFRDKEKLDVQMTIATYKKQKKATENSEGEDS